MNEPTGERNVEGGPSLDLEAIKARAAAATEGPWEWDNPTIGQHWSCPEPWTEVVNADVACMSYCYGGSVRPIESDADGHFIAHAREDIPALLAEVDEARKRLARVERIASGSFGLPANRVLDAIVRAARGETA